MRAAADSEAMWAFIDRNSTAGGSDESLRESVLQEETRRLAPLQMRNQAPPTLVKIKEEQFGESMNGSAAAAAVCSAKGNWLAWCFVNC